MTDPTTTEPTTTNPSDEPWLCATCAVEHPPGDDPPDSCPICADDRQYVPPGGQRWTTLRELGDAGQRSQVTELEPGLFGITTEPEVGIGQQSVLVQTSAGNLLWDPTAYLDDDLVATVTRLGGVAVIAASHPHLFGVQVQWSHRFGNAPVLVNSADAAWVQRGDPTIEQWSESVEPLPGVSLHRIGGHFPGSSVALAPGADGQGVLLTGDTVSCTPGQRWVSFMRSYPNKIPLSANVVRVLAQRLGTLDFDRVYDAFDGGVSEDAGQWVQRSAERYAAWVSGEHDDQTGVSTP